MTTLTPRDGGRYLEPAEVVKRMQAEFAYVETTAEGARNQVSAWLEQLAFVTADGCRADADRYIDQLERSRDAACFVHFGDDLGARGVLLQMLMIPHQPLTVEAHDGDEETWLLICRAAAALDYEVFEPQSEAVEAPLPSEGPVDYAAAA
jgi:hypothetical protein